MLALCGEPDVAVMCAHQGVCLITGFAEPEELRALAGRIGRKLE
jgi:hypothetical protein